MIVYGCCVGSWSRFQRYVAPCVEGQRTIATSGHTNIATAYNTILSSVVRCDDVDALVLLHDDLEMIDPRTEDKLLSTLTDPQVALVGVAGGRETRSIAWWDHDPIGHQLIDTGLIDFGIREGDVNSLEGSFIAFSPWAIRNLRFDERIPGFHGYDVDIVAQACACGRRVVVTNIDTHHHTTVGFKSPESALSWEQTSQLLHSKWWTSATS